MISKEENDYETKFNYRHYSRNVVTLLQAGTDFVRNNSKKAWRKVDDGRIEMPDYPERAVLEGVVNALIHRNYMEIGSEVHIDMFDDRKVKFYSLAAIIAEIQKIRASERRFYQKITDIYATAVDYDKNYCSSRSK